MDVAVSGSYTMRTSPFSAAIDRVPGTRLISPEVVKVRLADEEIPFRFPERANRDSACVGCARPMKEMLGITNSQSL